MSRAVGRCAHQKDARVGVNVWHCEQCGVQVMAATRAAESPCDHYCRSWPEPADRARVDPVGAASVRRYGPRHGHEVAGGDFGIHRSSSASRRRKGPFRRGEAPVQASCATAHPKYAPSYPHPQGLRDGVPTGYRPLSGHESAPTGKPVVNGTSRRCRDNILLDR